MRRGALETLAPPPPEGVLTSGYHDLECATCSIISVLTQWGATLVIQLRERERDSDDNTTSAQMHRHFAKMASAGIDFGDNALADPWA